MRLNNNTIKIACVVTGDQASGEAGEWSRKCRQPGFIGTYRADGEQTSTNINDGSRETDTDTD